MTEVEQQPPPQNGIDLSAAEEDDSSKARPADIEQDMREMERRKRVEAIMGSKLFREELERIVDSARDGGGILQQLSDIMGVPTSTRVGNVFKATNCMLPINDIRGVESMGYAKGEKILRCKLAATFRLLDLYGWTQGLGAQITARLKVDQENFLVNPYGMMYHEITASSLNKVDMQGQIVEQGTTNFGVNKNHFALHSVVHAARPDIRCAIYIGCTPVVAVSSLKVGLLPLTRDACVLGEVTTHSYTGTQMDADERDRLVRALGPNSKVLILSNYGALCCGETIEEAFFAASHIVKACETQLQLLPVGVDNLVLIPEESRKAIFVEARRPPEDLEKKFAAAVATVEANAAEAAAAAGAADGDAGGAVVAAKTTTGAPKWRVGGAEFEALMRMLDNAGYRTGYIYRHPLIKSDPPKPKNDVELPPAVSSLGYLLEEEELLKQGIWKKGDLRKGGDRSRWLNSPNVYQKVEVLETGTPDPKKITKWVAEGSPTHSTPVRIEDPLQFVPAGTNPKEFKRLQQQIKDNRRADKISAGPQSHILEGVTWDEANRIKDATVSSAGDHVVLMGAASKGIIQRGYQHNAAVYKAPYAKNPFDNVTDDELNEYKRTVERKKKSIHGEYTDTDFSESEPLSSMPISAPQQTKQLTITTAAVSQSEPEDVSEHQVMRIETQQAPVPSQPEVVLSDDLEETAKYSEEEDYSSSQIYEKIVEQLNSHNSSATNNISNMNNNSNNQFCTHEIHEVYTNVAAASESANDRTHQSNKENFFCGNTNIQRNTALIAELKKDILYQRQRQKLHPHEYESKECTNRQGNSNTKNTRPKSSGSEKSPGGVGGDSGGEPVGSPVNESLGGDTQQRINVESIGFRPIHPIDPRSDVPDVVTQQPHFSYIDPNNNGNVGGYHQAGAGGVHSHLYHHHCRHYHQRQRQQASPAVGIVSLPHFEQAFGHLLDRSANDLCALCYDNYAPCYELAYDRSQYPGTTNYGSIASTATDTTTEEAENPYKKSNACCTPAVCDSIFESLRRPASNENHLIFNIPFTTESPDTTTTAELSTPRKTRADLPHKSNASGGGRKNVQPPTAHSPYRTLSHFGFNSPQRDPQPEHKHIPCSTEQKKYVPLRKSISYEEIFSSPRYVDLCEHCFEKIVRLKPEIAQQTQMRLRNLCECNGHEPGGTCAGIVYQPCSDNIAYDYVEYASSDTTEETLPPFSSQLEPVLEVVEEVDADSAEDACKTKQASATTRAHTLDRTSSNSSFIEKIMRLNYSEESADWNFAPAPHKVAGSTNLTLELERAIMEKSQQEQQQSQEGRDYDLKMVTKHYNTENQAELDVLNRMSAVTAGVNVEGESSDSPRPLSITEIWEFMQLQDESDESQQQQFAGIDTADSYSQSATANIPRSGSICLYYEHARESNINKTTETAITFKENTPQQYDGNVPCKVSGATVTSSAAASDDSAKQKRRRSLMTREERSRRKLIFQELWEDHIYFLDGKELNALSDTESAIDGRQEQSVAGVQTSDRIGVDSDAVSAAVEQDVTDELAERNELIVVQTEEDNLLAGVAPMSVPSTVPKLLEAEVFNSRSIILKNCSSNTALRMSNDCPDDLDKTTQSETLLKLQPTEVKRFSLNNLINTRRECEVVRTPTSQIEASETVDDGASFYYELQPRTDDGEKCEIFSTPTHKVPTPESKKWESSAAATQNMSDAVQFSVNKERSEKLVKPKIFQVTTAPIEAAHFAPSLQGDRLEQVYAVEDDPSLESTLLKGFHKAKEALPVKLAPESSLHFKSKRSLTETSDEKRSTSALAAQKTKIFRKSFVETSPMPYFKAKKIPPKSILGVESDRPPTPKPPTTNLKYRKLSTPEPQSTILEFETKLADKYARLVEESASESDSNQSARTYNVPTSQEDAFFREYQLDNTVTDATADRMDIEDDEKHLSTNGANVEGANVMKHSIVTCAETESNIIQIGKSPFLRLENNTAAAGQIQSKSELEVAEILVNELSTKKLERAKAGMALPIDEQKMKSDHDSGVGNIPHVARVAQLTTEALKEPPSKVYAAPRITKRPRRNTNVLAKSTSQVASTSLQAAQHTAEELKLMYEPNLAAKYVLFKQDFPSKTSTAHAVERSRNAEDCVNAFDRGEMEFAELLESEEHEDLTKLSEEFEELLLNVENLQLQPQTREVGGAEPHVVEVDEVNEYEKIINEADSHLNVMEQKILRKIRENQLNKSDEIFDKIEATIRNKMTSSQIEMLIKEQSLLNEADHTLDESKILHNTFTASTPERILSAHSTFGDSGGDSFVREQISGIPETGTEEAVTELEPNSNSIGIVNANESSTLTPQSSRDCSRKSSGSNSTRGEFSPKASSLVTVKLRRSRSLTPSTGNCELSSPPPKLNKTTTPPQEVRKSLQARDSKATHTDGGSTSKVGARTLSRWPRASSSTPEMKPSKRNFILENIRNVSLPRHSGVSGNAGPGSSVKRLQGNAQAIFCHNPFESVKACGSFSKILMSNMSNSSFASSSTTSSSRTLTKSNSQANKTGKQLSPRNSSSGVYTFQSKLVRGSPRFWVSLTQPNAKKLQAQKRRRRSQTHHHHRTMRIEPNDSTSSLREYAEWIDNEQEEQVVEEEEEEEGEGEELYEYFEKKSTMKNETVEEVAGMDLGGAIGPQEMSNEIDTSVDAADGISGVEHEIAALGKEIQQLQPRLDNYKRKMSDFGDHVAKCTRHMDDCITVQGDIAEERRQLREQMALQQYAEQIMCQVQTYSLSETED
ncbi:uncharacterized protein LOC129243981 isoform X1 [Anastrepha obliqua]|uniref:uncharacterized protein LOC129243981 isoform X1 n=1 Tax=Anastrepha obliqua TaxID=95512 RepID=UPI00240A0794|nr:uncharacterized protein LOC129243981 isoform X1 [Anastrepha obliqua]XP_054737479.1 uncharacterized protein LOC129243981 isoform X1 [Anastrepha obliqua]XP_054737480.1 uncharacterized protein LOC129243981 isoform X1 [Anastrepha obliqua]XP_054737481.1 uncharacterized protein LOC129243981 isoform X1 [Anastrepha obliqua]XP_054737482.1 uncharacterized protein LOC129243981 isoform X1 [Anastrepha obliqua]XP_054737483.1 uncharacterized protein LOC129243981 isoform X1 [Anastrepha obliqua]XP_05473748